MLGMVFIGKAGQVSGGGVHERFGQYIYITTLARLSQVVNTPCIESIVTLKTAVS